MQQRKLNVGLVTFSYGGNGGISSEVPDIREWMVPLVAEASRDPRIDNIRIWNLADTPITMTRNRAVLQAREFGVDVLVMIDSDMKPDCEPDGKKFFPSSFDFLYGHYEKGPVAIGAPYCGPPPHECVYIFEWRNMQTNNPNPDFQLKMYERSSAVKMTGIQECAALPTGMIMYDMRVFELTEPKTSDDKPWFYYEYPDKYQAEKASTEDVTQTRDLSLVGTQKLGYNPVFCNWDAWAGHWKPKCVGKPQFIEAKHISDKLKQCWEAGVDNNVKLTCLPRPDWLPRQFDGMGMDLPEADQEALTALIRAFAAMHGRGPKVCEVGSWAGRSAIVMAKAGASVHCVDTWEGSKNDEGCKSYDGSRGTPLDVFRKNVEKYDITYTVGRSPEAASHFADGQFDIVYIDAEHDRAAVAADIKAWLPKAKYILAGHDYHAFAGVREAIAESGLGVTTDSNVWQHRKRSG
jgi:hypothetical protein